MSAAPVVRAVTVAAPAARAFEIFTARIGDWWPLATHSPADALSVDLSFVGGSLVEVSRAGDRAVWGLVTEWEPPSRLAFTWSPGGGPVTAIRVDFEESGGGTRVVLTHTGWEVYGDAAPERRTGYSGEFAWQWVLDLFALAVGGSGSSYDIAPLRAGYEALALALEGESFGEPEAGEWSARQVAGHVITNAELMCRVVDDVRRGRDARLHGPDDHAPEAVNRCDGGSYEDVAADVRRAAAGLVARCCTLTGDELETPVSTYIEHHGVPVVDGDMALADLLAAEVGRHLPAHVGQVGDLAV